MWSKSLQHSMNIRQIWGPSIGQHRTEYIQRRNDSNQRHMEEEVVVEDDSGGVDVDEVLAFVILSKLNPALTLLMLVSMSESKLLPN